MRYVRTTEHYFAIERTVETQNTYSVPHEYYIVEKVKLALVIGTGVGGLQGPGVLGEGGGLDWNGGYTGVCICPDSSS